MGVRNAGLPGDRLSAVDMHVVAWASLTSVAERVARTFHPTLLAICDDADDVRLLVARMPAVRADQGLLLVADARVHPAVSVGVLRRVLGLHPGARIVSLVDPVDLRTMVAIASLDGCTVVSSEAEMEAEIRKLFRRFPRSRSD
jgi:hypothetical protein